MSPPRFAAWGALDAVILSSVFVGSVAAFPRERLPFGLLAVVLSVAGTVSASGTLALARLAEGRVLLDARDEVGDAGLSESEERELLAD